MHTVGEDIGSVIELEDSGSDDDDEQVVTVDDCEHEFTRYEGEDPLFQAMNAAYDAWSTWEPTIPVEIMLKNAIDGGGGGGGLGF
jgi:hypothetical protein